MGERVSPSFASIEKPGSGSNAYFHSILSKQSSLVLTEAKGLSYLHTPKNVMIFPIPIPQRNLGGIDAPFHSRVTRLLKKFKATFDFLLRCRNVLNNYRPDIVHLYTPIHMVTGLYCKIMFGSKVVMSLHGTDVLRLAGSPLLRVFPFFIDHIFFLSLKMSHSLNLTNISCSFLGNGYDDKVFYFDRNIARKKYVLTVGNLRWQKDQRTLINAFSKMVVDFPDYSLVIVGSGELECELRELACSLSIESKVDFKGDVAAQEVANLMRGAAIFAISSITEGSPKVVLEALACGTPVVATSVGDLSEMLDSSFVSAPGNVADFAANLKRMAVQADLIDREALAGSVRSRTWRHIADSLDDDYERLLN